MTVRQSDMPKLLLLFFQDVPPRTNVDNTCIADSQAVSDVDRRDLTCVTRYVCVFCFWTTGIVALYYAKRVSWHFI